MPDLASSPYFLLGCFADFYEEVASIKLAFAQGRLSSYLAVGDETPPTRAADLAARVSARLEALLRQQASDVRRRGSVAQTKLHLLAQYVMASMADEIFILELDWPGREAWLQQLLEYKLFRSHDAGRRFFSYADQLLHTHNRSVLHADLASVFLLALQLGFKGQHRGDAGGVGDAALRSYRQRLYQFSNARERDGAAQTAFAQAYRHRMVGTKDERLAPLSRWYVAGQIALAVWVAASTVVWAVSLYPFEQTFGGW